MELIYATLLLHAVKQKIDEENLTKVLSAAGAKPDAAKIKALVSSLEGINIDEALKNAVAAPVAAAPQAATAVEKKEERKAEEDASKKAEEAAAGLGALFG